MEDLEYISRISDVIEHGVWNFVAISRGIGLRNVP